MICNEAVGLYLETLKSKFACDVDSTGRLCIVTPYVYADHDNVEIFVRERSDRMIVSDLGETLRMLDTLGMDITGTPNLLFAAKRIAGGYGTVLDNGVILKEGPRDSIGQLILDVTLACRAVGDLIYLGRSYEPTAFNDEVAEYLLSHDITATQNVPIQGMSGKEYMVRFKIDRGNKPSLFMETVDPKSMGAATHRVNSTFRLWSDVDAVEYTTDRKISLVNDDVIHFREHDLEILRRVSHVCRWTERQSLLQLAAA